MLKTMFITYITCCIAVAKLNKLLKWDKAHLFSELTFQSDLPFVHSVSFKVWFAVEIFISLIVELTDCMQLALPCMQIKYLLGYTFQCCMCCWNDYRLSVMVQITISTQLNFHVVNIKYLLWYSLIVGLAVEMIIDRVHLLS